MQTHAVISLYPETRLPEEPARAFERRTERRLRLLKDAVDLSVTAFIGLGVLVCFGLVFTML